MIKIKPDTEKAKSLRKMAVITLERLETTEIEGFPSNSLVDFYEIIRKLMEAISLENGIKIKGEGAHQELIEYMAKQGFIDQELRIFLQDMRDIRNRISYEGFLVHKNYIVLNRKKIYGLIERLSTP